MKRLIVFLLLAVAVCGLLMAQKKMITFTVTVVCPDAGGLDPHSATYRINAPNQQAAAGMAMAKFKQDQPVHRNHKQGIYEITEVK